MFLSPKFLLPSREMSYKKRKHANGSDPLSDDSPTREPVEEHPEKQEEQPEKSMPRTESTTSTDVVISTKGCKVKHSKKIAAALVSVIVALSAAWISVSTK